MLLPNITFHVDEEIIKKAKKIAVDKDTTITAMLREYLHSVVNKAEIEKKSVIQDLEHSFSSLQRDMGNRKWTRDELHERHEIH